NIRFGVGPPIAACSHTDFMPVSYRFARRMRVQVTESHQKSSGVMVHLFRKGTPSGTPMTSKKPNVYRPWYNGTPIYPPFTPLRLDAPGCSSDFFSGPKNSQAAKSSQKEPKTANVLRCVPLLLPFALR